MANLTAALLIGLLLLPAAAPERRSLDDVLAAHVRSRGPRAADALRIRLTVEEPEFTVEVRYVATRSGRMRVDVFHENRRVFSEGIDERGAWAMGEKGPVREGSEDGLAALEHGRLFNLYGLEELPALGHRLVLEEAQRRNGRDYDVVRIELADGFRTWRWIDAGNGRIEIKRDFRALHPDVDPRPVWIETRLSEFRDVAGEEMAFTSRQVEAGTERWLQTTTILDVERNVCLTDAELRRPA